MKILIYARHFAPSIGGMERLMQVLAEEFQRLGHTVAVATETPGAADLAFPVHRAPSHLQFLRLVRESDAVLAAPLSLRRLPMQVLGRRRVVVAHPILLPDRGRQQAVYWLKRLAMRCVVNVVPSEFMARHFANSIVIPNPLDRTFAPGRYPESGRSDVLFVGRLSAEKGCDVLLDAMASLAALGSPARLTIVGDGPMRGLLERRARDLGLAQAIAFTGSQTGAQLLATMRAHRVMVVPTRCEEAFGIVAIEGLAAGCRLVVADTGGLPEAVGDAGLLFVANDAASLAQRLSVALSPEDQAPDRDAVARHLAQFDPERIARRYLALLGAP